MNAPRRTGAVLGLVGCILWAGRIEAVPPVASNVTALGRWPAYATGQATDAHQINEYLYVALEEGGFQILNVKNPQEPVVLWSVRFPGSGPVAILGQFVYVGGSELHILEVPDPTRPIYRGGWGDWDTKAMVLAGHHGFLVGQRGLLIVDLADPSKPVGVSTNEFAVRDTEVPRIVVEDNYAYVVHGTRLRVIDVADKSHPQEVGVFVDQGFWPGLYDVVVRNGLAYVGSAIGLHLIDVSNPETPTLIRSEELDAWQLPIKSRLLLNGNYLYAGYQGRLASFDLSDPLHPAPFPRVDLVLADDVYVQTGDPGVRTMRLSTAGELVMARGYDGVELMSLADPKRPRSIGKAITYCDVRAVRLAGNHAYILNFPAGIQVLDLTVPSKPNLVRTEPYPHSHLRFQPFDSVGSLIFVLSPSGQLDCLDFADLSKPPLRRVAPSAGERLSTLAVSLHEVLVTSYEYEGRFRSYYGKAYELDDKTIRMANNFSSLDWSGILGCHSLVAPPRWATPGGVDWIKNDRAYHLDGELTISDLVPGSGLAPPRFRTPMEGCFRLVSTTGYRDYLGGEGIVVLNTGEPDAPVNMGRVWTNRINGLSADGRYLVFTDNEGLKVMEAGDPLEPHLVGYYNAPDMHAVAGAGRFALVARGQEGLLSLDLGEDLVAPPRITRDIRSLRVSRGAPARFDLSAVGSPPMRYQWFRDGHSIPGETNAFLYIAHVSGPDTGRIVAAARNEGGHAASSVVSLVMNEEPFVRLSVMDTGDVFAPRTWVHVQIYAQDDLGVSRFYLRRNGWGVTVIPIDPPERECWRELDIQLPEVGTQVLTVEADDTEGATSVSDPYTVQVTDQPTFFFANPYPVVSEVVGSIFMEVDRVNGLNQTASVHLATADLTARAISERGPGHYTAVSKTLQFNPGETRQFVLIDFVNNNVYQGDRAFLVRLSEPSLGWRIWEDETRVTIQDDDSPDQAALWTEAILPSPAPDARSSLQIRLEPPQVLGQWRFLWETRWHDSEETVTGLVPGNYRAVFLPRSGYVAPPDMDLTIAQGMNETLTEHYLALDGGAGSLSMRLLPEAVIHWFEPGGWRLQGSSGAWLESGAVLDNLPAGTHLVEFKVISGFAAPAPQWVEIIPGHTVVRKARYAVPTAGSGDRLLPLPDFRSFADGMRNGFPYAFNGQLLTDVGYASGCVVRPHTVLTAAHAIFSSESLSYVSRVWWFFQRHRGEYEPVPIEWRGSFMFSGYAAARTNDILRDGFDPGQSSGTALGLDVAAIYFDQAAGRGGYGGFTVWPTAEAWLDNPSPRLALSYPVENIPEQNVGRLHQLGPERYYFSSFGGPLLSSADVRVQPGSSGGPVCVRGTTTLGEPLYFPSAVQLGGTDRMIIRLIDFDVADLILRAENASGGTLDTGGGFIRVENSGADSSHRGGLLSVRVGPPVASRLGGAWRVSPTNYGELRELVDYTNFSSQASSLPVVSSAFGIETRALPGFLPPSNQLARVVPDANVLLDLGYVVIPPQLIRDPARGLGLVGTPQTSYRVEARLPANGKDEWTPVGEITLEAGTNWLPNVSGADATGRVHRAVWLSE